MMCCLQGRFENLKRVMEEAHRSLWQVRDDDAGSSDAWRQDSTNFSEG